ncbi:hypothetical protein X975_19678, partial [Stegodyphus mimosarum]
MARISRGARYFTFMNKHPVRTRRQGSPDQRTFAQFFGPDARLGKPCHKRLAPQMLVSSCSSL